MRFALYVHVPYCRIRCPFCDFNVVPGRSWPEEDYAAALLADLDSWAATGPFAGGSLSSLYFGGGTPSLFAPDTIARLIEGIDRRFAIDTDEVTLEANPETLSLERLRGYRLGGVTRLSIGIQSFHPHVLARLGREQSADDTLRAVPLAREAGFENLGVDLIFGVPGQSRDDWRRDLERVIAQNPEHISAYGLTYEAGTPFTRWRDEGRLEAVSDEAELACFDDAREAFRAAGFRHYEVSNYARPGRESVHNRAYWSGVPYLGVGAGAHSYLPDQPERGWGERWESVRDASSYQRRAAAGASTVDTRDRVDPAGSALEAAYLGLRRAEGLDLDAFEARFGRRPEDLWPRIGALVDDGLLQRIDRSIALTERGLRLADSVIASLTG